jgi:Fe(3+) dicitrate transport protein
VGKESFFQMYRLPECALGVAVLCVLASTGPALSQREPEDRGSSQAADEVEDEARPRPSREIRDLLLVTGGAVAAEEVAGSSRFIGEAELERQAYSDIHRVLGQVEGVSFQEEDGFGLRPNIGMRGTGVSRSEKITLLEDGVLIAPAPYSAPAAYYFPTMERMEAVEVRKGSSAVAQGPYTTGGVINLVTSGIPGELAAVARVAVGSHDLGKLHGRLGDSGPAVGWLLEAYRLSSDGFKDLDGAGSTGVVLEDYLGKLRWSTASGGERHHSLEVKLGRTFQESDETYLGITALDFERTPYRRYAASQQDSFDSDHGQTQLSYLAGLGGGSFLSAVVYRNEFARDWYKLQSVAGVGLAPVLASPDLYAAELALLRGEVDSTDAPLALRHNRRDYLSQGLDSRLALALGLRQEIEIGVRFHHDEEDRFQEEDTWNLLGGRMSLAALGVPGSQANRIASADARALYLEDTIRLGRLTLRPGLRVEHIDFERLDYGRGDPRRTGVDLTRRDNSAEVVLPGFSASYSLGSRWTLFAGIHRGFAAPGPGQDPTTDAEESTSSEAGFNYRSARSGARLVTFFSDYSNLIGRDTLAAGGDGTGATFNGGEATVYGCEASYDTDLGHRAGLRARLPLRLGYTWTWGRFDSSFETAFADWAPEVQAGDRLPYVAEHRLTLAAGFVAQSWQTHLNLGWTDKSRTRPGRGPIPPDEVVDDVVLVDVAAEVGLLEDLDLTVQARNLLDETYLAARRPAGLRPGMPRTLVLGLRWRM